MHQRAIRLPLGCRQQIDLSRSHSADLAYAIHHEVRPLLRQEMTGAGDPLDGHVGGVFLEAAQVGAAYDRISVADDESRPDSESAFVAAQEGRQLSQR